MSKPPPSPGFRIGIDYGPLAVFLLVNFAFPGPPIVRVLAATAAFIAATALAMIVSWVKTRHISPMLLLSGALVIVFGGLTLWFHDQRFIQMKPTFVYTLFAGVLGFGLATGRPLLEQLLGSAYPGLTPLGWRKVTINWTAFFVFLAIANEVARATLTFDQWAVFKFPGCAIVTALFAVANVPMLLRHGLALDGKTAAAEQLPPE